MDTPEVWVLKRDPAALPTAPGFSAPIPMDSSSFGTSIKTRLLDTLVVRSATPGGLPGGLGAGDLLVLVNDGRVLRYSADSIKNFLAGARPIALPQTLIAAVRWPSGQTPTGMAVWPTDGSLLFPTIGGAVLRFGFTATGWMAMPPFATGLGLSLGKIKTFVRSNTPYAVFDQPLRGKIFEFVAPTVSCGLNFAVSCNPPMATITTVSNPIGLATTDSSAPTQDCVFDSSNPDNGCTLLGGTVKLGVSIAAPGATIVDTSCTIDPDPRFDSQLGTCNGSVLHVETYCPGYGPTVIPQYLCGGSGASGHGFALIKSVEQNGFLTAPPSLLVKTELSADALLGPLQLGCPQLTMAWAPLSDEGMIPEGNEMIELTSYCGSSRALPPGHSLMGVGLQLTPDLNADNPGNLVAFANQKFSNLGLTIAAATINQPAKQALSDCATKASGYLNDTQHLTDPATRYSCAAHQVWTCDHAINVTDFGLNPKKLSAYSAIRGRLANLILTINTRLNGNAASMVWPLADPGLPSGTNCDPDTTPPSVPAGLTASYVNSNTGKNLLLQWSASTDPSPNASGIGGYRVYLGGVPVGTTTNTTFPITLNTNTSDDVFQYQVTAFDQATPTPNESNKSSAVTVSCYDPDKYTDPDDESDCDAYHP